MLANISIILGSILMSSTAHVLLKKGTMSAAELTVDGQALFTHIWTTATNPWVLGGMSLHVGALVVWLWALSRVDVSFAYPFLAVGYVIVSLLAWQWLGESISPTRIFGMSIIITGIIVLSRG
ncbi:MAG: EamA family transporter [Gammaproteobacteria bacterium]|nr:EamA family transporter [Gammaproteobacteria bacterium]